MDFIFKIKDKTGREIHLSKERRKHVRIEHPTILEPEEIEEVLKNPVKILQSDRDEKVQFYFLYKKQRKEYLKVAVKYLNGNGFIITAHYTLKIQ